MQEQTNDLEGEGVEEAEAFIPQAQPPMEGDSFQVNGGVSIPRGRGRPRKDPVLANPSGKTPAAIRAAARRAEAKQKAELADREQAAEQAIAVANATADERVKEAQARALSPDVAQAAVIFLKRTTVGFEEIQPLLSVIATLEAIAARG